MDLDRPHRPTPTTTTGELFLCFTSRLSKSSSMRLSSSAGAVLSPRRAADKAPLSLPSSLSRRLRSSRSRNGSLKGGQSPMFPKKRGGGFENPEPSSPKVTCIGQVRVKTKKQGKKMKLIRGCSRSQRLSNGGEASFRRIEHEQERLVHQNSQNLQQNLQNQQQDSCLNQRNQKWVHFPLTICEGLRAFGAEFSCFFPCKSSCFSSSSCGGEKGMKGGNGVERDGSATACGAVFRWLVAVQEGEGGKERDIELVVGEEEREERRVIMERECSRRRSIFDDMEFKDEIFDVKNENGQEEGRVSTCVPPKNALLLMRCRSDPMKMAALANKSWVSPVANVEDEEEKDEDDAVEDKKGKVLDDSCVNEAEISEVMEKVEGKDEEVEEICEDWVLVEADNDEFQEAQENSTNSKQEIEQKQHRIEQELQEIGQKHQEIEQEPQEIEEKQQKVEEEDDDKESELLEGIKELVNEDEDTQSSQGESSVEPITVHLVNIEAEIDEKNSIEDHEDNQEQERDNLHSPESTTTLSDQIQQDQDQENDPVQQQDPTLDDTNSEENNELERKLALTQMKSDPVLPTHEEEKRENEEKQENQANKESSVLPDCLLLMMCEPKLSMEVSKETWVCSTDFLRWLPERRRAKPVNLKIDPDEPKKRMTTGSKNPPPAVAPAVVQPPRASISFPAVHPHSGLPVASAIEQKLVNGVAYEPFVLTRCKSEPMRSAAAKLGAAPERACCWKNRKVEPHQPARVGVGAAGIGF